MAISAMVSAGKHGPRSPAVGCWDNTATAPGWEVYRRAANEIGSESAFGDV